MLYAKLNDNGATTVLDLSNQWTESLAVLQERLFFGYPSDLKLNSEENNDTIKVSLYSDSDFGNALIKLLSSEDTLMDAYILEDVFKSISDEIKDALECDILNEQYSTKEELYGDIIKMKKSAAPFIESFYCPLRCSLEDLSGGYSEISGDEVLALQNKISAALKNEQTPNIDMAEYLGEEIGLTAKLKFAEWNITEIRGELYGRIDCYMAEELTEDETKKLIKKIEGQNSDGFGENFEQIPIKADSGDLYVSFWSSSKTYFLCKECELEENINRQHEIKMGGI